MDEANAARYAHDVLLVAAGKWAYACFTDFARSDREGQYTAYICQAGRSFRSDVERLGYYVNGAIRPEFPLIFARRDHVDLTPQTAREFRSSGDLEDARFAAIVEQAMIDPHPGPVEQIFLLSGPRDPRTLRLGEPIRNSGRTPSGRRIAYVRGQRYVSEAALLTAPESTGELDARMTGVSRRSH